MSTSYLYERRKQFRLHYPPQERPLLVVDDVEYMVNELSEGGMQALFLDYDSPPDAYPFDGVIRYVDGEEMLVTGRVLRSHAQGFSVKFEQGVSLRRIMHDQLRLKKKYPSHFD